MAVDLSQFSPDLQEAYRRLLEIYGGTLPAIKSGYRDPATNKSVGGAKGSQHLHGNAIDWATSGMSQEERLNFLNAARQAGFQGFGGYSSGNVHTDVGPARYWGDDYSGKSAPDWLKSWYSGAQPESVTRKTDMSMNPNAPQRTGLLGFMDLMREPDPSTGMTAMERFGAALDPLLAPEQRMGQTFAASGAQRLQTQAKNKTKEWLKTQKGGEVFAQAIDMGVPVSDVYSAFLKSQQGDYVVVGNSLVDRKTGTPIFTAPTAGQSSGTIRLPDGTEISLGKQTDTQAGSMDFGSRMDFANKILESTEQIGANLGEQFFSKIPVFGGALTSPEFKQYDQARRTFVNAVLRRESGAAIAESEFESANKQYFPQPFDPPEVIEQKRAARELVTTMMLAASGPNATTYAKAEAEKYAKMLNPLYGTEEYEKERQKIKSQAGSTTAGGNERLNF